MFGMGEVLLLSWNCSLAWERGYTLLEVFSGMGKVSQKWHFTCKSAVQICVVFPFILPTKKLHPEFWYLIRHSLGHTVASFDYDYSKENMDFLSVSGFLLLISTLGSIWIWSESLLISSYFQFLITILQLPRLILYAILNMAPRALSLWAPDCGSWGIPCRGTSMRSYINPDGYVAYGFVARANMMISRFLGCLVKASKKFWT